MKNYIILTCIRCNREIIVPKSAMDINDDMRCAFRNCKCDTLKMTNSFDSMKDCMCQISFKREDRKLKQNRKDKLL